VENRTLTKVEFRSGTGGPVLGSVAYHHTSGYWFVRIGDAHFLRGSVAAGVEQVLAALVAGQEVTG
jgi:hypothetical protein